MVAGKRSKDLWLTNMMVATVAGLAASFLTTIIGSIVFGIALKEMSKILVADLCFAPTAAFLIGLSTIHYRNYSRFELIFKSVKNKTISKETIIKYIDYLKDSFLIESAIRYDIKGKKYINTPSKYYFTDLGLRNARLNFRQVEETHEPYVEIQLQLK